MVDNALSLMDSDVESDADSTVGEDRSCAVVGARFRISVIGVGPFGRTKDITCTRLNERKQIHSLQFPLPSSILVWFERKGHIGEEIECRTEAAVAGVTYRAHPNFQGGGPWCDFAMVTMDHKQGDSAVVDDKNEHPAKILGFYRPVAVASDEHVQDFSVLVHSGGFQKRDSPTHGRRTLLTRSWLFEVEGHGQNPLPDYMEAGTTKSNFVLGKHTFAVEEMPGLDERYGTKEQGPFIVYCFVGHAEGLAPHFHAWRENWVVKHVDL